VSELYYTFEDRPNTKFNMYTNKNIKLTDLTIKMLGIYRTKKSTNVISDMNKIKKSFDDTNSEIIHSNTKVKSNFDSFKYLNELLMDDNFDTKKYYLQKIYSKTKPDEIYVFGGINKMKSYDVLQYVDDKCIEFVDDKLKVETISEKIVRCETEGLLIVDNFIMSNTTINCQNILIGDNDAIKKRIFMSVQHEKMIIDMSEKKYGDKWYVAYIGNNKKKFVFAGIGNVLNKLSEFYNMSYHNDDVYNNFIEFLSTTKWNDIVVKCIEKNIDVNDIEKRKILIMNKFDRDILMNYNDDKDYVTKKELEKIKSLCFGMMRKK
jgi:hypothetical protein